MFLKTAKEHGVVDLLGLDGEWISIFPNDIKFKAIDLEHPMQLDVQFDLAISLEVAEHLPKHSASDFINFLTSLSPVVLFSAAIPFQGGEHHVNEQWQEYWTKLFANKEYVPIDCIRPVIWNNTDIFSCYRQNTLVYVSKSLLLHYSKLAVTGICNFTNSVHPEVYTDIVQRHMNISPIRATIKYLRKLMKIK